MRLPKIFGALAAGFFLVGFTDFALGKECGGDLPIDECPSGQICTSVNIPNPNNSPDVPSAICATGCLDARDCGENGCCGSLGICEDNLVAGSRCSGACPCPDGTICCPKKVCEAPLPNTNPAVCAGTCGEWDGTCDDPERPVPQPYDTDCSRAPCVEKCCGECDPNDDQCPYPLVCCDDTLECVTEAEYEALSCGDPHMTGFLGQKFDFTGEDGGWYALIADGNMNINMRVTSPVANLPEITYITGLSVLTNDADGFGHSIVIEVRDPHNLESSCPAGVLPCLADGSLRVVLDGKETLLAPGTVSLAEGVQILAANLPGACRSFGFEQYWERKKLENARQGRRLSEALSMGEWILADPTATNMEECAEYVTRAEIEEGGLFTHQSEHASFQIVTPEATIRLSHGRLHQIATRDPTDQYDLPDHLTWQMNMAVDHNKVSPDAKGVLGETFVPTRDASGKPIMIGMEAIRGKQEDYRVEGALGMDFIQGGHTS